MRRPIAWGALVFLMGCGASITGSGAASDAASGADGASPDGGDTTIDAAPLGRWSTPGKVTPAATGAAEDDVTLSSDALELIFAVEATSGKDLYYTSRASK